ncbi:MAG: hypothetical protein ABIJ97_06800 [Bacteroidota bacterium]
MYFLRCILIILLISLYGNSDAKNYPETIESFKKSRIVFLGKIIGIQEVDKTFQEDLNCFKKKYIVEFEVEKIFKGKRFEKILIYDTLDVEYLDYYIINREYFVYLKKVKKNLRTTKYGIIRSRRLGDESTQNEIYEVTDFVDKHWFRRIKNPEPFIKFISGGCNC